MPGMEMRAPRADGEQKRLVRIAKAAVRQRMNALNCSIHFAFQAGRINMPHGKIAVAEFGPRW